MLMIRSSECVGSLEVELACHVKHIQVVTRFCELAPWELRASALGRYVNLYLATLSGLSDC
jgi:hypothetical protein